LSDFILPYLLDVVTAPESENLILAGGLGLRLKYQWLLEEGTQRLIPGFRDIRATQDMDFFLQMTMFLEKERASAFRDFLRREQYEAVESAKFFHFTKQVGELEVKIDLLARSPRTSEKVTVSGSRVKSGVELHGRITPEAFSLDDSPFRLPLKGTKSNGESVESSVLVPHPYTWLNMKVRSAADWLKFDKPGGQKHVKDVYALTAILTEEELAECRALAERHRENEEAIRIKQDYEELFGSEDSLGRKELMRQVGTIDSNFFEGLQSALGVERD
jgi:hypothetical protein